MTDDLPFQYPSEPTVNVTTKRCRRHFWMVVQPYSVRTDYVNGGTETVYGEPFTRCDVCGVIKDPAVSRRSRNNKNRGLAIQRKRIEGLGGTNLAGNNENLDGIGLAFAYESKSGGAFSERIWRWLTGIPTKGDQTGVLIVTETPGPGRRARSYVVVTYDEWRSLHGEEVPG